MKGRIFIAIILSALSTAVSAQEFKTGDNIVSLGLGLGSSLVNYDYSSQGPGISMQYEHGQWDVGGPGVISLGGYLGFKSFKYNSYYYSQKQNFTIIGIRSAYHYNGFNVPHLDVYGGLMLSYDIVTNTFTSTPGYEQYEGSYSNDLALSLYLGGRYYFSENIGAFMEIGYGVSYITIGGCYKF
jgi:hypothetical protein